MTSLLQIDDDRTWINTEEKPKDYYMPIFVQVHTLNPFTYNFTTFTTILIIVQDWGARHLTLNVCLIFWT